MKLEHLQKKSPIPKGNTKSKIIVLPPKQAPKSGEIPEMTEKKTLKYVNLKSVKVSSM